MKKDKNLANFIISGLQYVSKSIQKVERSLYSLVPMSERKEW